MAFQKKFIRSEALDKSANAFWKSGYSGTSVSDLVEATGLNRGSLYSEFSDKRGLFIDALTYYDLQYRQEYLRQLGATHTPREAILAAFEAASGAPEGCLLVNTALEVSPHDPEIRDLVSESLEGVRITFRDWISAAQAASDLPNTLNAEETAGTLLALFLGLRVLARSGADQSLLDSVRLQAKRLLQESSRVQ